MSFIKFNIVLMLFVCSNAFSKSTPITVVTEHFPPYQIANQGQPLSGLAVDFVSELLKKTQCNSTIEVYPWARAYKMAREKPNVLIFSITRSPERERLFQWVGSFGTVKDSFWSLKANNQLNVSSLAQAKQYSVVVPRDDNTYSYLSKNGFKHNQNLYVVNSREQAVKMLMSGRVDLLLSSRQLLQDRVKSLGFNFDKLRHTYALPSENGELAIAFSLSTDSAVVAEFRQAFDQLKHKAKYQTLFTSS